MSTEGTEEELAFLGFSLPNLLWWAAENPSHLCLANIPTAVGITRDAPFAAGEPRRFRASDDLNDVVARNKTRIVDGDFGPRRKRSSQPVRWPCVRLKYLGQGTFVDARQGQSLSSRLGGSLPELGRVDVRW